MKDSAVSTKLCLKCYRKVLSYHKFKCLALKSDAYLKSKSALEESSVKPEVFIKDNIKTEQLSISDDSQNNSVKDEVNIELFVKDEDSATNYDTDDEFLSVIKKIKYEYIEEDTKEKGKILFVTLNELFTQQ